MSDKEFSGSVGVEESLRIGNRSNGTRLTADGLGGILVNGVATLDGQWVAGDHGLIAWSYDPSVAPSTFTPVSGTLMAVRLKIRATKQITNIHLLVTTGGTLTASQSFAGVYQGGVQVGVTADQSSSWNTSGEKKMAIVGGPITVASGDIQVCWYSVGSPMPIFRAGVAGTIGGNINLATTSARYATADTGLTTALPGTLATLAGSSPVWAGVS